MKLTPNTLIPNDLVLEVSKADLNRIQAGQQNDPSACITRSDYPLVDEVTDFTATMEYREATDDYVGHATPAVARNVLLMWALGAEGVDLATNAWSGLFRDKHV